MVGSLTQVFDNDLANGYLVAMLVVNVGLALSVWRECTEGDAITGVADDVSRRMGVDNGGDGDFGGDGVLATEPVDAAAEG
jgi:hypothetical protein